jgi:hypothetical protein
MNRPGLSWAENVPFRMGMIAYGLNRREVDELIERGATCRFETSADLGSRITATRLAVLGVFALAARKRTGHFCLTFELNGAPVKLASIPPKHEHDARLWAARFNKASAARIERAA